MSEATATAQIEATKPELLPLQLRIAWRNLWRNRKRTWLTAGGIAFAILLVNFLMALQAGVYEQMRNLATGLFSGHAELSTSAFLADGGLVDTLPNAKALVARLAALDSVRAALPRAEAFALVSVAQRSFGAQVIGVDLGQEQAALTYLKRPATGRLPNGPNEAIIGSLLARNLRAEPGAEIVVLGSGKYGGVAAAAWTIVGTITTGIADMDRTIVVADLAAVQSTFELEDQVHRVVLLGQGPESGTTMARQAASVARGLAETPTEPTQTTQIEIAPTAVQARSWQEMMPDVKQTIDIDKTSGQLMYWILLGMVSFTVMNSFVMTIFERTREFGMLRAIGMKPSQLIWLLQWESLFIWLVGSILGVVIASTLVLLLSKVGISLGEAGGAINAQLFVPTQIYPALTVQSLVQAPAIMFVACQLASLLPALRLFKLQPVEALRES